MFVFYSIKIILLNINMSVDTIIIVRIFEPFSLE